MVGRNLMCVCGGGGEILSGNKSIEAQGWDILRMDWPLTETDIKLQQNSDKVDKTNDIFIKIY